MNFDKAIDMCVMVWIVALVAAIGQWPNIEHTRKNIESYVLSKEAYKASGNINRVPAIVSRQ